MQSMTGYGHGEASNKSVSIIVELRSVNARFRDIHVRLPRYYLSLETRIKSLLQDKLHRGRIEVHVRREATDGGQQVSANPQVAEQYLQATQEIAKRLLRDPIEIPLTFILQQPGVLTSSEPEPDVISEWDIVATALDSAIADLLEMRFIEGLNTKKEMSAVLAELQRTRGETVEMADSVNTRIHKKLEMKLMKLLGDHVDPNRLAQEGAILADKSDISEELLRIQSHCDQLTKSFSAKGPVGRKMDFILQELNREINTIGSKASESAITNQVISMKSLLEKLREQAANIE